MRLKFPLQIFEINLPYYKNCNLKLKIEIDNNACKTCLNWNLENSTYFKELVKDIGGCAKKLIQLSLEIQKDKSRLPFNDVANGK